MRHLSRLDFEQVVNQILGERLPGAVEHPFFTQSLTPKYKIGSRKISPGGLVWHYSQAGAIGVTATYRRRAVACSVDGKSLTNFKTIGITPIGGTVVVIDDTDTDHGEDYWANGKASIFPTAPDYSNDQSRIIKSSTASDGTSVTLVLYQPVYYAIPNNADIYCCPCPYKSIDEAVSVPVKGANSMLGFTWMPVTPYYFCWVQTWGLCQPVTTGGDMGITAGDREVYFNYNDGTVLSAAVAGFATNQHAGFIAPVTILAPGGDEAFIMLQLDP